MSARSWIRARDPGLATLRRAGRGAIVMPALFALGDVVIGDAAVATFAAFVLVANGSPYTYAGRVAIRLSRESGPLAGRLDFAAPVAVTPRFTPRLLTALFRGTIDRTPGVLAGHALDRLEVRCDRPLPLQADGEDLGDVEEAVFEAEPDVLTVVG